MGSWDQWLSHIKSDRESEERERQRKSQEAQRAAKQEEQSAQRRLEATRRYDGMVRRVLRAVAAAHNLGEGAIESPSEALVRSRSWSCADWKLPISRSDQGTSDMYVTRITYTIRGYWVKLRFAEDGSPTAFECRGRQGGLDEASLQRLIMDACQAGLDTWPESEIVDRP